MDNRFGMCLRHPNQPIANNRQSIFLGIVFCPVKTCLVCKSESQALGEMGPDCRQSNSRQQVQGRGNSIEEVQQSHVVKREGDKETKVLGTSSSSGNWEVSDHSQEISGTSHARTIDEDRPKMDSPGAASLNLLDLEILTQHRTNNDESKNTILSSTSSLHTTEDEWAEQVRCRVLQVRSWEDRFAIKNHFIFGRYFKMVKLGVPFEAVKDCLAMDGYDSSILDLDENQPLKLQTYLLSLQTLERIREIGAFSEIPSLDRNGNRAEETELSIPETVKRVLVSLRHTKLNQVFGSSNWCDQVALRKEVKHEVQNNSKVDLGIEEPKSMQSMKSMPDRELVSVERVEEVLSKSEGELGRSTPAIRGNRREHPRRTPRDQGHIGAISEGTGKASRNDGDISKLSPLPISREKVISLVQQSRSFREDRARNLDAMDEWRSLRPKSSRTLESSSDEKHQRSPGSGRRGQRPNPTMRKGDVNLGIPLESVVHKRNFQGNSKRQDGTNATTIVDNAYENEQTAELSPEHGRSTMDNATGINTSFPEATGKEKAQQRNSAPSSRSDIQPIPDIGIPVGNACHTGEKQSISAVMQKPLPEQSVAPSEVLKSVAQHNSDTGMEFYDENPALPTRKASFLVETDTPSEAPVQHRNLRAVRPFDILETVPSNESPKHQGRGRIPLLENVKVSEAERIADRNNIGKAQLGFKDEIGIEEAKRNGRDSTVLPMAAKQSGRNSEKNGIEAPETPPTQSRTRQKFATEESPPIKEVVVDDDEELYHEKLQFELESLIRRTPVTNKQGKARRNISVDDVVLHHGNKGGRVLASVHGDDRCASLADTTLRTEHEVATFMYELNDGVPSKENLSQKQRNPTERVLRNTRPHNSLGASRSLPVSMRDVATQCSLESVPANSVTDRQNGRLKAKLEASRSALAAKDKSIIDLRRELRRRDKTIERLDQRVQSLEDRSKASGKVLQGAAMQAKIDEARKRQTALREKFVSNRLNRNTTVSASGLDFAALALSPADRSRQPRHIRGRNTDAIGNTSSKRGMGATSVLGNVSDASSRSLDSGLRTSIADWKSDDVILDTKPARKTNKSPSVVDASAKKVIMSLFDSWSAKQFTTVEPQPPKSPTNGATQPAKAIPRRRRRLVERKLSGPLERKEWDTGEEKEPLDI